jgi:hypothetical protein
MTNKPMWRRLSELESKIIQAVPPIDPPSQHWLSSDATYSYCYPCARKARAAEMGIPAPPDEPSGFSWEPGVDEAQATYREFEAGIDGGFDTSGDDSPQSCETCGSTLRYTLTDYGVEEEIAGFEEGPPSSIDPETSYALTRIFLNLTQPWAEEAAAQQLKRAVLISEQAVSVIPVAASNVR